MGAFEAFYGGIGGVVFRDLDRNGKRSANEPGLPGQLVYLDVNLNGGLNPGERVIPTVADDPQTTAVSEGGSYLFDSLDPGVYRLDLHLPAGWLRTRITNVERASEIPGGAEGNGQSWAPSANTDGRFIAFQSSAGNLVGGNTNSRDDIVVLDRQSHTEQAKLHYTFVYGADDRVLCWYNVADTPPERIVPAVRRLTVALYRQLDAGGCASWAGCLNAYAVEVRQRAACVDYPLTPTDEETLQLMQVLAAEVDAGRLSPDDTLAVFEWWLGSPWYQPSWSCLRP